MRRVPQLACVARLSSQVIFSSLFLFLFPPLMLLILDHRSSAIRKNRSKACGWGRDYLLRIYLWIATVILWSPCPEPCNSGSWHLSASSLWNRVGDRRNQVPADSSNRGVCPGSLLHDLRHAAVQHQECRGAPPGGLHPKQEGDLCGPCAHLTLWSHHDSRFWRSISGSWRPVFFGYPRTFC